MTQPLNDFFTLNRRYTRAVNLERDLEQVEQLKGYILTERAEEALRRILAAFTSAEATRAWTLTSVYGTGKSSFAQFLVSLCAPQSSAMRACAEAIASQTGMSEWLHQIPVNGLVRAAVTAQREPITQAILRALRIGLNFWRAGSKARQGFEASLTALEDCISRGEAVEVRQVVKVAQDMAATSKTGLLLVIDELGKCLEYAVQSQGAGDLYLLQQLSELPQTSTGGVFIVGLLHQSFTEYGYELTSIQRNEWSKIHGRFAEISFAESPSQMVQLVSGAIKRTANKEIEELITRQMVNWHEWLGQQKQSKDIFRQSLEQTAPLHPLAALALPILCIRYAQNDRSLFTFLTSQEPHSLRNYLQEQSFTNDAIPLLKADRLYDYFLDSIGSGITSRSNFTRWNEVKSLVDKYRDSSPDEIRVLKTIGILNLTEGGSLKAFRLLVAAALCDTAGETESLAYWEGIIDQLIQRGAVQYRPFVNELRIWEGSDFDLEAALRQYVEQERSSLATLLETAFPLRPAIAQRHSFETGTLRLFEQRFLDASTDLTSLSCQGKDMDGLIGYWLEETSPEFVPQTINQGKPFVLVRGTHLKTLRVQVLELNALKHLQAHATQLQIDAVARREIRSRIAQTERLVDATFSEAFDVTNQAGCFIDGQIQKPATKRQFNNHLSILCDHAYAKGLKLKNELINRRDVTSQIAKARREILKGMLERPEQQRLGLTGNGPDASIYDCVLKESGIHRLEDGGYGFFPPEIAGIKPVWDAIESFCVRSGSKPRSLGQLYQELSLPPYGVKPGVIPLLLTAVLLHHVDDVCLYYNGTFVPVLTIEYFDLLIKDPSQFAVKHFSIFGLRAETFREMEGIVRQSRKIRTQPGIRNTALLSVLNPLLQFVRKLPAYPQKTAKLEATTIAVRKVLLEAHEPDRLLFELLPQACGLPPITGTEADNTDLPKKLRAGLSNAVRDLEQAHEKLLNECESYLSRVFQMPTTRQELREHLRVRASRLSGRSIEPLLTRFVTAATERVLDDETWLQGLVMVIADKPSESWNDTDLNVFELKLSDLARRFKHLERLIADLQQHQSDEGHYEAFFITLTRSDGTEEQETVMISETRQSRLLEAAQKVKDDVQNLPVTETDKRQILALLLKERLNQTALQATTQTDEGNIHATHPRSVRG